MFGDSIDSSIFFLFLTIVVANVSGSICVDILQTIYLSERMKDQTSTIREML